MAEGFMVGPAVDEAAELLNLAQGGIVWLAPSAKATCELRGAVFGVPSFPLVPYVVPLKSGDRFDTLAVAPGKIPYVRAEWDALMAAMEAAFDSAPLDVQVKRQNTVEFLQAAQRAAAAAPGSPPLPIVSAG